jgi:hypothetical protein
MQLGRSKKTKCDGSLIGHISLWFMLMMSICWEIVSTIKGEVEVIIDSIKELA